MSEIPNLRVHIAPVGYEIDRIVLPAKKLRADKVILLVHDNPSQDRAVSFYEKISDKLEKLGIDVYTEHHNRTDLFQIIKTVRRLISDHPKNIFSVNLASGSKIQAIGCMMACMMFNDNGNVNPFYVEAEEYLGFSGKPISVGIKEIEKVPIYEIKKPEQRHIQALKIIHDNDGKISKKEMAKIAKKERLIIVNAENESQAAFASLDQNIISPLENQWRFIKIEKIGRTRWVELTSKGREALEMLE